MGCPPDPVEVSLSGSGERIMALENKFRRLLAEYAEAEIVAQKLIAGYEAQPVAFPGARFTVRTDVPATEFDPYAGVAAQARLEAEYERQVKALENRLCDLRTRLLADETQRALHLAHRREDRMQWIEWLRQRAEFLEFQLRDKNPGAGRIISQAMARQMIKNIHNEIDRLENIPDDILMSDRGILQVDENKWLTPYPD